MTFIIREGDFYENIYSNEKRFLKINYEFLPKVQDLKIHLG